MKSNYSCFCHPPETCSSQTCLSSTGCFYSVELTPDNQRIIEETYGCLDDNSIQICPVHPTKIIQCCHNETNLDCNKEFARLFHLNFYSSPSETVLAIVLPIVFFSILLAILIILAYHLYSKAYIKRKSRLLKGFVRYNESHQFIEEKNANSQVSESGSGAGYPFLVKQTISRQTVLVECIGKGRFGEVWKAKYKQELVAVKIFTSRDEASWSRETDVYTNSLLRHPNLLVFYASDIISHGSSTQLWLITAYHSKGSLYDYLKSTESVNRLDCLKLIKSCIFGLSYLHLNIEGTNFKPTIAHRDIKSKNILVKDDGEVCIADLGLALMDNQQRKVVDNQYISRLYSNLNHVQSETSHRPSCFRVGTKRYMSPELLLFSCFYKDNNIFDLDNIQNNSEHSPFNQEEFIEEEFNNLSTFENQEWASYMKDFFHSTLCQRELASINHQLPFEIYLSSDVYSLSLVMWEILNKTKCSRSDKPNQDYSIPFEGWVSADPSFQEMRNIVIYGFEDAHGVTHTRPLISQFHSEDATFQEVVALIQSAWHMDWRLRPKITEIKRSIIDIQILASEEINLHTIKDPLQPSNVLIPKNAS